MAEYIKREELNKWLDDLEVIYQSAEPPKPMEERDISELCKATFAEHFADLPSIDIVHCKDCKHMKPKEDRFGYLIATCEYAMWTTVNGEGVVKADDYCSCGEKIDG